MDHITPETIALLRAVLDSADLLRYTRPDDPLMRDLHRHIAALRRHLPDHDIHPGLPASFTRRRGDT